MSETRALNECRAPPRHVIISKWENPDLFLHPDSDPSHSPNLMGSKTDQNLSVFMKSQPVAFA